MGPPGAGKGTQGAILSEARGLPKFATGDLLRDAVRRGTPLGLRAKSVMEAGHLVSDDIIMGIVREELAKPEASKGVIFDGVVRTVPQAEGVERTLNDGNDGRFRAYLGMKHSPPFVSEAVETMRSDGIERAESWPARWPGSGRSCVRG